MNHETRRALAYQAAQMARNDLALITGSTADALTDTERREWRKACTALDKLMSGYHLRTEQLKKEI